MSDRLETEYSELSTRCRLLQVSDLRKHGITLHLMISTERQSIPDVPAIYFVEATEENVQLIVAVSPHTLPAEALHSKLSGIQELCAALHVVLCRPSGCAGWPQIRSCPGCLCLLGAELVELHVGELAHGVAPGCSILQAQAVCLHCFDSSAGALCAPAVNGASLRRVARPGAAI